MKRARFVLQAFLFAAIFLGGCKNKEGVEPVTREKMPLKNITALPLKNITELPSETVTAMPPETVTAMPPETVTAMPSEIAAAFPTSVEIKPFETEETLLAALGLPEGQSVMKYFYDDFDGDGNYELFAFGAETDGIGGQELCGSVYFVNYLAECQTLLPFLSVWDEEAIRCMEMTNEILFVADQAYVSEVQSHVYGVEGKEAVFRLSGGYIDEAEAVGEVTLTHSAYDICEEGDGFFTGHSWKAYYFFYDEASRCFREYGAIEITEEEFLSLTGSGEIMNLLAEEGKGEKTIQFYYRSNNTVQINFSIRYDTYTEHRNLDLHLDGTEIISYTENGGSYLPALFPERAVYPERFLAETNRIQR